MAETNGVHATIHKVLVIGAVFPATPIIKALTTANLEVHVAHPRAPSAPYKTATYHECKTTSTALEYLFSQVRPDVIVSTVSGGSYDTQKTIIDAALAAGVPRFIPYEFGQDSLNTHVQERIPPSKERARVVSYLQTLAAEGKISWVGIATGVDLDRGLLNGNLGYDIKWQSATIHGNGGEHFAASSGSWLGRVVLAVLQHWDDEGVKDRYLYAAGLVTSSNALLSALEKATGHEFVASHAEVEECVQEAERRIARGFPDAGMFLLARSVMYDERIAGVRGFEEEDAKARLGLGEGEKLEEVVEWVLHEMKHHERGGCGCD